MLKYSGHKTPTRKKLLSDISKSQAKAIAELAINSLRGVIKYPKAINKILANIKPFISRRR